MRSCLFKSVLMILAVMLPLFILEYSLSLKNGRHIEPAVNIFDDGPMYRLDPDLIYPFKPKAKGSLNLADITDSKSINSFGLRNREISAESRSYRIIAARDSFTEGIGVTREESYPGQLEIYLKKETGLDLEVVNAGVSGYSPDQTYRYIMTKLLKLKPDIILWNLTFPLDIYDASMWYPSLYDLREDQLIAKNGIANWLYLQNFLSLYTPSSLKKLQLYRLFYLNLPDIDVLNRRPPGSREKLINWSLEKIKIQVATLNKLASQKNFKLFLVLLPTKDLYQLPGQFNLLTPAEIKALKNQIIKSITGVEILDIEEMLNRSGNQRPEVWFYANDIHPNAVGNAAIASAAAELLRPYLSL